MVLILVSIGVLAGTLSGIFGIGGGIILVPALVFFLKFAPHTATGTSLSAMLLPVGALGVWHYFQTGKIGWDHLKAGGWIALGMFLGAFLGSRIAVQLPVPLLQRGFAILLVGVAVRLWFH